MSNKSIREALNTSFFILEGCISLLKASIADKSIPSEKLLKIVSNLTSSLQSVTEAFVEAGESVDSKVGKSLSAVYDNLIDSINSVSEDTALTEATLTIARDLHLKLQSLKLYSANANLRLNSSTNLNLPSSSNISDTRRRTDSGEPDDVQAPTSDDTEQTCFIPPGCP